VDGEGFIGSPGGGVGGVAESAIPACFGVEEFDGGMGPELRLEMRKIFFNTGEELRAERVALCQERGEGGLGWGAEGKIGVGYDFETIEGGTDLRGGAGDG